MLYQAGTLQCTACSYWCAVENRILGAIGTFHTLTYHQIWALAEQGTECISDLKTPQGKSSANSFLSSYAVFLGSSIDVKNQGYNHKHASLAEVLERSYPCHFFLITPSTNILSSLLFHYNISTRVHSLYNLRLLWKTHNLSPPLPSLNVPESMPWSSVRRIPWCSSICQFCYRCSAFYDTFIILAGANTGTQIPSPIDQAQGQIWIKWVLYSMTDAGAKTEYHYYLFLLCLPLPHLSSARTDSVLLLPLTF